MDPIPIKAASGKLKKRKKNLYFLPLDQSNPNPKGGLHCNTPYGSLSLTFLFSFENQKNPINLSIRVPS